MTENYLGLKPAPFFLYPWSQYGWQTPAYDQCCDLMTLPITSKPVVSIRRPLNLEGCWWKLNSEFQRFLKHFDLIFLSRLKNNFQGHPIVSSKVAVHLGQAKRRPSNIHLSWTVPFKPSKEHLGFTNYACDQRRSGCLFTFAPEEETDSDVCRLANGNRSSIMMAVATIIITTVSLLKGKRMVRMFSMYMA